MAGTPSLWRWALYASLALLVAAVIVTKTDSTEAQTSTTGVAMFVAAATVYVIARIAIYRRNRSR